MMLSMERSFTTNKTRKPHVVAAELNLVEQDFKALKVGTRKIVSDTIIVFECVFGWWSDMELGVSTYEEKTTGRLSPMRLY